MNNDIGIKFDDNTFFVDRDEFLKILKEGVKEGVEKANKESEEGLNKAFKNLADLIEAINAARNDNNNTNVVTGSNGEEITLDFENDK